MEAPGPLLVEPSLDVRNFDISPDGQRFLMIKDATQSLEPSARDEITVVLNWTEELKTIAAVEEVTSSA
jgi:hypothetical protein